MSSGFRWDVVDWPVVDFETFPLFTLIFSSSWQVVGYPGLARKKRQENHQESVWQSTELHVVVDLVVTH